MDWFSTLFSPNIKKLVLAFKHGNSRQGQLDNIHQYKKDSRYDYIQNNVFLGQGLSKVYLFKMSIEGERNGVDLVACT